MQTFHGFKALPEICLTPILANCYYSKGAVGTRAVTHNPVPVSEHHKNSGAVYLKMHQNVKMSGVSFVKNCTTRLLAHISPGFSSWAQHRDKTDVAHLGQHHTRLFLPPPGACSRPLFKLCPNMNQSQSDGLVCVLSEAWA